VVYTWRGKKREGEFSGEARLRMRRKHNSLSSLATRGKQKEKGDVTEKDGDGPARDSGDALQGVEEGPPTPQVDFGKPASR